MSEIVSVTRDGHIAVVEFNRPQKHNALSLDMFDAIIAAGESLRGDDRVRAVVVCGAGPSFCAGLDFEDMQKLMGDDDAAAVLGRLLKRDGEPDNIAQRAAHIWRKVDAPVIAALHGAVFGGGLQIALGADLRIADPDAQFSIMEVRYGLIPDMGITQALPDLLPIDKALELTWTSRVIDATEAERLNLVTRVVSDPRAIAMETAATIAAQAPSAVRAAKRLYQRAWRADQVTGLTVEESLQRELIGGAEQIEAVMAAAEKRAAKF